MVSRRLEHGDIISAMRLVAHVWWAHHTIFFTTPAFVLAGLWVAAPLHAAGLAALLCACFVGWPIFEWWLHRHLLHDTLRTQHWRHHVDPLGDVHILPFLPEAILTGLFLGLPRLLGAEVGGGLFAGFALGFGLYHYAHWFIHYRWWPSRGWLGRVAARHALHHEDIDGNYNVLLPLGDWLFGTFVRAGAAPDAAGESARRR